MYALFRRDGTGELRLRWQLTNTDGSLTPAQATVYLREGFPIYVDSGAATVDVLGQVLRELGWISDQQLNESLVILARGGRRHGEILMEMGTITAEHLRHALTLQLRRKMNRIFAASELDYEWVGEEHGRPAEIHTHPLGVIMQGVRSSPDSEGIAAVQERLTGKVFKLPGGFEAWIPLYSFQQDELLGVQALMNGYAELTQLRASLGTPLRTIHNLVRVLELTNVLTVRDAGEVPTFPSPPPRHASTAEVQSTTPTLQGVRIVAPGQPEATPPQSAASAPPAAFAPGIAPPTTNPGAPRPAAPPEPRAAAKPAASTSPAASPSPRAPGRPRPTRPPSGAGKERLRTSRTKSTRVTGYRRRIRKKERALEEAADHFAVLELKQTATGSEVQGAYRQAAKEFHPDRVPKEHEELRPRVVEIFRRVQEAYEVLSDDKERLAYIDLLKSGGPLDQEAVKAIMEAERQFFEGDVALKRRQWTVALEAFSKSVELAPEEVEYKAARAWVAWNVARQEGTRAGDLTAHRKLVEAAIKDRPNSEKLVYWAAEMLEAEGKTPQALNMYKQVVQMNPHHTDAKRKIKLADHMGAGADKAGKGLLGGLFGRKK